jgi:hypothetical protein
MDCKKLNQKFHGALDDTKEPSLEAFHNFFINESPDNWLPSDSYYIYDANQCIGNKGGEGDGYWRNIEPIYKNGSYYMPMGKIIMIKFIGDQWVKYHPEEYINARESNPEIIYETYRPNSIIKNKNNYVGFLSRLFKFNN